MLKLKFDLDPNLSKVVVVAILLMCELILIKIIEITSQGRFPTPVEWALLAACGLLQLVTYLLTFLRKDET